MRTWNAIARAYSLLQRWHLFVRVDGLWPTIKRAWNRFCGTAEQYVFVQRLKAPAAPVILPVEVNGIVMRQMVPRDRDTPRLRRYEPREIDELTLGVVATRGGQIIGAEWYTDSLNPGREWYVAVEPHLIRPAWLDAGIFVAPGEKGAAWTLFKTATDVVASAGIRCTVALVTASNSPSIFLLRLLGAKMVGRIKLRYRFGVRTAVVEPVAEDKDTAITTLERAARRATRN